MIETVGYQAFLEEGGQAFGAVRGADPERDALLVYVENAGDFLVPVAAVRSAHDGKVILDHEQLDARLRQAIEHAHDSEDV